MPDEAASLHCVRVFVFQRVRWKALRFRTFYETRPCGWRKVRSFEIISTCLSYLLPSSVIWKWKRVNNPRFEASEILLSLSHPGVFSSLKCYFWVVENITIALRFEQRSWCWSLVILMPFSCNQKVIPKQHVHFGLQHIFLNWAARPELYCCRKVTINKK